jgi:MtN3 and saliva related transmembrane protein
MFPHLSWTTLIGLVAAGLTTISSLPQVLKILKSRRTSDISLATYAVLTAGLLLWCVYGVMLMNLPIILADGIAFVFSATVLGLKIRHG